MQGQLGWPASNDLVLEIYKTAKDNMSIAINNCKYIKYIHIHMHGKFLQVYFSSYISLAACVNIAEEYILSYGRL